MQYDKFSIKLKIYLYKLAYSVTSVSSLDRSFSTLRLWVITFEIFSKELKVIIDDDVLGSILVFLVDVFTLVFSISVLLTGKKFTIKLGPIHLIVNTVKKKKYFIPKFLDGVLCAILKASSWLLVNILFVPTKLLFETKLATISKLFVFSSAVRSCESIVSLQIFQ